ncbi:MAG: hypothetical protein QRY71_03225 [Candidatus Rhabdochlamydia sp.]
MTTITNNFQLKKELQNFKTLIEESLEDPVTTGSLVQTVTLLPCGHHLSQETAEKVFKQNQQCPLDNLKIEKFIPNLLFRDLTKLCHHDVYDFHHLILEKFKTIGSYELLKKAVTLVPCGHSTAEEALSDKCCPLDKTLITHYLPDYTLREMNEIVINNKKALEKLYEGKSPVYSLMINPKTPLEDLQKISPEEFQEELKKEPKNAMLYYNYSRILHRNTVSMDNGVQIKIKQALLETTIRLDPDFAEAYYELALFVEEEGVHLTTQGEEIGIEFLLTRAIKCDPNHAKSYLALALKWSRGKTLTVPQGFFLTQQDVFIKAIDLNPKHAELYRYLGLTLDLFAETVTLLDGRVLNRRELYEIAIEIDPSSPASYDMRCQIAGILLRLDQKSNTVGRLKPKIQQLCCDAIDQNPHHMQAYKLLAMALDKEEKITLPNQSIVTRKDLLLKVIDLEPTHQENYTILSKVIQPGETVTLLNNSVMTQKDLVLKGMRVSETVSSSDTVSLDQIELLGRAFSQGISSLEQMRPQNLENFISQFLPGQSIKLEDGTLKSEKEVYQIVIQKHPTYYLTYYKLGLLLFSEEKIQLNPTLIMDREALFLEAIRLNPEFANSYQSLAFSLAPGKVITLPQGKKMGVQQLLVEAIRLNPRTANFYYNLGSYLPSGKTVEMPSKEKMQKMGLFLKTLELDPKHVKAYCALAETLPSNGTIQIPGKERKNRFELYLQAFELSPNIEEFLLINKFLSPFLQKREKIRLSNGNFLPFKEFMTQVKTLSSQFFQQSEIQNILNHPSYRLSSSHQEIVNFYKAHQQLDS